MASEHLEAVSSFSGLKISPEKNVSQNLLCTLFLHMQYGIPQQPAPVGHNSASFAAANSSTTLAVICALERQWQGAGVVGPGFLDKFESNSTSTTEGVASKIFKNS